MGINNKLIYLKWRLLPVMDKLLYIWSSGCELIEFNVCHLSTCCVASRKCHLWPTSGPYQACYLSSIHTCQITLHLILLCHNSCHVTADMSTGLSRIVATVSDIVIALGPGLIQFHDVKQDF